MSTSSPSSVKLSFRQGNRPHPVVEKKKQEMCMSRTLFLRSVFVVSLVAAAAVCGFVAFRVIRNLEQEVGAQTYESVANSALTTAQEISLRKIQGGDIMATILSYAFPYKEAWPFVALDGYEVIAGKVANMSSSSSQIVAAVVTPEQREDFETFAQNIYTTHGYPETAGYSDFGFGIWTEDNETSPYDDGRVHDVNGTVSPQSDRNILIPLYQHNLLTANSIMANLHSIPAQGHALARILDCADEHASLDSPSPACGFITDFTQLIRRPGPACIIFKPIYPMNDQTVVVGFTGTSMYLDEVLVNVVPDYVRGLYVVFSTDTAAHTFLMDAGVPVLLGEGDFHDTKYDEYARSAILYGVETNATGSATYTITLYPSEALFETFQTNSPLAVSLGFVAVICFSIGMFFLYDYFMKFESQQRKALLEMKRRFVRFVSHEIRTPLNTVGMGLALLQSEMMSGVLETLRVNALLDYSDSSGEIKKSTSSPDMPLTGTENGATEKESKEANKRKPYYSQEHVDLCLKNWLSLTKEIHENSEAAVAVLTDLLDFDKIQTGTLKLDVSRVQIFELVHRTACQFQIHANNKHVTLELVSPQVAVNALDQGRVIKEYEHLLVIGDDMKLSQCIRNLVSNALKFTPESGVVEVETSYVPNGLPNVQSTECCFKGDVFPRSGSVRIAVKDTGPGMSLEQQEQLFQEFVQFDPNKLQGGGGSGLGLCIAKEIIEQHRGSISATSKGLGKGSTFVIEIPLYSFPAYREDGDSSCRQSNHTSVSEEISDLIATYNHCILIVDDVLSNRKFLAKLLERAGHTVQVAKNGQEAIDAVKADLAKMHLERHVPFDTILMDSEMPVLCGPEATKIIRDLRHPATIVGCTGNVLPDDVEFFKSCGAETVLPKPIKLSMLDSFWREQGIASTV